MSIVVSHDTFIVFTEMCNQYHLSFNTFTDYIKMCNLYYIVLWHINNL